MAYTTDFDKLYLQELNGQITEVWDETTEDRSMDKGNIFFDGVSSKTKAYNFQMIPNVGDARNTAEGADFAKSTYKEGYNKVAQQFKITDSIDVTYDMRLFDDGWLNIGRVASKIMEAMYDKIDQSKADVINNAFATSYTDIFGRTQDNTTADGLALASDVHSVVEWGQTFGNIIYLGKATGVGTPNPVLGREGIIAGRAQGAKFEDSIGVKSDVDLNTLLVHTDDEDQAMRLVYSKLIPGSDFNDTNKSLGITDVVSWNRLTPGAWQLFNSADITDMFQMNYAEMPNLITPETVSANGDTIVYKLRAYYALMNKYPKSMFFSKGTDAA